MVTGYPWLALIHKRTPYCAGLIPRILPISATVAR